MQDLKTKSRRYYLYFNLPLQLLSVIGILMVDISWIAVMLGYVMIYWLGIQAGSHKLFAHRCWNPRFSWIKYFIAWLGCFGMMGGPVSWAAYHRWHHTHSDGDKDPHSPKKGLWHAWIGWLMSPPIIPMNIIKDYVKDRALLWIDRHCISMVVIPLVPIGLLDVDLAISILLSMTLTFHSEMAVNALLHKEKNGQWQARNIAWLGLISGGSSLHANHHQRPSNFTFATRWYELDPSSWFIRLLRS